MPVTSKALKPCSTAPDTPPNCETPQAPVATPGLPHSDPVTAISLDPGHKAAEYQAANNLQPSFKAVDEVWDEKVYRYTMWNQPKKKWRNRTNMSLLFAGGQAS
ncbi:hypothetical protein K469DRAFT_692025 [Zopfia rhizophila CBS 207.26]|uniref:Uncharacterized protein n=1 Tax=Zopfia rhizophila CBS 207.26 TaxID=1314779 RepID=A0A6A6DPQ3_9PEZI|nr:hypothetical protein K469DRAFT_692025 [Zopfia rhizophila CBS 207.26]